MTKAANSRSQKAAQDGMDIGNISYLDNPQQAYEAYQKAITINPSNSDAIRKGNFIFCGL